MSTETENAREVLARYDSVTNAGGYGAGDHALLADALRSVLVELEGERARARTEPRTVTDDMVERAAMAIAARYGHRSDIYRIDARLALEAALTTGDEA